MTVIISLRPGPAGKARCRRQNLGLCFSVFGKACSQAHHRPIGQSESMSFWSDNKRTMATTIVEPDAVFVGACPFTDQPANRAWPLPPAGTIMILFHPMRRRH